MSEPLGITLNNPGNIRFNPVIVWKGSAGYAKGFVCFTEMKWGVRAAAKLLRNYITMHGCNTVETIINRWAPPTDNNPTEIYIGDVCARTGFTREQILEDDEPTIRALLLAMILQEQGRSIDRAVLDEGVALAFT